MGTIADLNELTAPAVGDYWVVRDVSDVLDKDKKLLLGKFPLKDGTPVALRLPRWKDANSIEDSGILVSDVGRLSVAQTNTALKTFSAGINLGQTTLTTYEEGSWTPVLTFGAAAVGMATTVAGRYVRIGAAVNIWGSVTLTTKGSSVGNTRFDGLPFTASNITGIRTIFVPYHFTLNHTGVVMAQLVGNQTGFNLENEFDGTVSNVTDSAWTNGDVIFFSFTYRTGA